MKHVICSLALAFSFASCYAGSFGGPPPFTNGSPLISGVDGAYQAVARADGLTGVIRFSYSSGSQTSTDAGNRYVFFIEGLPFVGPVTASIMGSTLGGVLEMDTADGADSFTSTRMTGYFNGKFDTESSTYSFNGSGFAQTFIEIPPGSDTFSEFFGKSFKFKGVRNSLTPL